MSNGFEIAGSIASFLGTAWLTADAISVRRNIRSESGANRLHEILDAHKKGSLLKDERGKDLNSEEALRLWFADRTLAWNWIGLAVIAFGFALDLVGKLSG